MAFNTYDDLGTTLTTWLDRDLSSEHDDFIGMVEENLENGFTISVMQGQVATEKTFHPVRVRHMEDTDTLTLGAGSKATLPADFLEMRSCYLSSNPQSPLKPRPSDELHENYPYRSSGTSGFYDFKDTEIVTFPASVGSDLVVEYYAKIPTLASGNQTNWVTTHAPTIYLYGCLFHASTRVLDQARIALFGQLYATAVYALISSNNRSAHARKQIIPGR